MNTYRYVNKAKCSIQLSGPNKERIKLSPGEEIVLPAWYSRYVPKYLKMLKEETLTTQQATKHKIRLQPMLERMVATASRTKIDQSIQNGLQQDKNTPTTEAKQENDKRDDTRGELQQSVDTPMPELGDDKDNKQQETIKADGEQEENDQRREEVKAPFNENLQKAMGKQIRINTHQAPPGVVEDKIIAMHAKEAVATIRRIPRDRIVGVSHNSNAYNSLQEFLNNNRVPISNDIGIGILSYNRALSLMRLLESIKKYTDLNRTMVFVSDESEDSYIRNLLKEYTWIVSLPNVNRIGVAGNSNRLLRCLARFKYKFLLNDDVEILSFGWEHLYINAMKNTSIHHFCFRQPGLYGANDEVGVITEIGNTRISTVNDRPHGAVMVFDDVAFNTVGFMDETFGIYGMEHVDWSNRVSLSGIQPPGFHDVVGSNAYLKVHKEQSAINNSIRVSSLDNAKKYYSVCRDNYSRIYVGASDRTRVPSVSCIIPCRITEDRYSAVDVVINNMKMQKYPVVEIIKVEHDTEARMVGSGSTLDILVDECGDMPFNKSMAFNVGVIHASSDKLVLHDADMLVADEYIGRVSDLLNSFEACHIGAMVIYLSSKDLDVIFKTRVVGMPLSPYKTVDYFEGGSLGCNKDVFVRIGGFCEDFWGYGYEDCEFFNRLKLATNFFNTRSERLLHLEHGRDQNWKKHWEDNRSVFDREMSMTIDERIQHLRTRFVRKYVETKQ